MFGHDDTNPQQDNPGGMPLPQLDTSLSHLEADDAAAPTTQPATTLPANATDDTAEDTAGEYIMTDAPQAADPAPVASVPAPAVAGAVNIDDLLDIKRDALQQLTPLLGHLDQSPEEKFRTTMMLIQASDNQDLLKDAYEAAQQIEDEKARAQALLDVVNEINYFTQQGSEGSQADGADQESM